MENLLTKYEKTYSENKFWTKLKKFAKKAGIQIVYLTLLLYNVLKDKETPPKSKLIITAALGYFILPTDLIPDFILGVGYADDFGALMLALAQVISYLKPEHKTEAKQKLKDWFGDFDDSELSEVEKKLEA